MFFVFCFFILADGYARSEAGVAILMQRRQNAKRVYATVVGTESSCDGFKEYGCNTVSVDSQINLYKDTYDRFNLNPLDITFVEAHGYSTKVCFRYIIFLIKKSNKYK